LLSLADSITKVFSKRLANFLSEINANLDKKINVSSNQHGILLMKEFSVIQTSNYKYSKTKALNDFSSIESYN
jgi:hypothetical protein